MITQARLKELFEYNQDTGLFTRKIRTSNSTHIGDIAGYKKPNGYMCISIDHKNYYTHRLAWLYMTGIFPEHDIDHIDSNRVNNAWINLREATRSENMQNLKVSKNNNKTGYLGVSPKGCKFIAQIKHQGEHKNLGLFNTPIEAHQAYLSNKRQSHPFGML